MTATIPSPRIRAWWERPGLEAVDGRLRIAGRDAAALARAGTTPLYVYDLERSDTGVGRAD